MSENWKRRGCVPVPGTDFQTRMRGTTVSGEVRTLPQPCSREPWGPRDLSASSCRAMALSEVTFFGKDSGSVLADTQALQKHAQKMGDMQHGEHTQTGGTHELCGAPLWTPTLRRGTPDTACRPALCRPHTPQVDLTRPQKGAWYLVRPWTSPHVPCPQ